MSHTVRAYLPATFDSLAILRQQGELPAGPAFAVTAALREQHAGKDQETLEYAAFTQAVQASLTLLAANPAAAQRRVVVSVDAPVLPAGEDQVRLAGPVPLSAVAAIHVDSAGAEPLVASAVADGLPVDEELEWYDVSELELLAP